MPEKDAQSRNILAPVPPIPLHCVRVPTLTTWFAANPTVPMRKRTRTDDTSAENPRTRVLAINAETGIPTERFLP